jgi:hypothetical protein
MLTVMLLFVAEGAGLTVICVADEMETMVVGEVVEKAPGVGELTFIFGSNPDVDGTVTTGLAAVIPQPASVLGADAVLSCRCNKLFPPITVVAAL